MLEEENPKETAAARFDQLPERIRKKIAWEPESGCWIWQGYADRKGYGRTQFQRKKAKAHRFVYEMLVAEIPLGHQLSHSHDCIAKRCVNPQHLEPLTQVRHTAKDIEIHRKNGRAQGLANRRENLPEGLYRNPRGGTLKVEKYCPVRRKLVYGGSYSSIREALEARDRLFSDVEEYKRQHGYI